MDAQALRTSGYLDVVRAPRGLDRARVEWLTGYLSSAERTLEFLLRFLGLRLGPLRPIPEWLDASADACEAKFPQAAQALREAAALERTHQWVAEEDLERLHDYARRYLPSVSGELPDDPRIDRHMRVRALVPARSEPVALAIDLELAMLGNAIGPMLDMVCRNRLPLVDGCQFVRIRRDNASTRARLRSGQLGEVLRELPRRAAAWGRIASDVTGSYLDALEVCVDLPVSQAA